MSDAPVVVLGSGLAGWTSIKEFRKHDSHTPVVLITASSGMAIPNPPCPRHLPKAKLPRNWSMAKPLTWPPVCMCNAMRTHARTR